MAGAALALVGTRAGHFVRPSRRQGSPRHVQRVKSERLAVLVARGRFSARVSRTGVRDTLRLRGLYCARERPRVERQRQPAQDAPRHLAGAVPPTAAAHRTFRAPMRIGPRETPLSMACPSATCGVLCPHRSSGPAHYVEGLHPAHAWLRCVTRHPRAALRLFSFTNPLRADTWAG